MPRQLLLFKSATSTETLVQFERDLCEKGDGYAPNGARYRLTSLGRHKAIAVERTYRGQRTVIVGFSGRSFLNPFLARAWAILDGRHAYADSVSPLQRELLV